MELYQDVLSCISRGVYAPARIISECNLSWGGFQSLLWSLTRSGYVRVLEGPNKVLFITAKGKEALHTLMTVNSVTRPPLSTTRLL
jgi:predicted transcriptional regulator